MTGRTPRGKRVQIYLSADLVDRWERTPRYERSAVVAEALRAYWQAQKGDQQSDRFDTAEGGGSLPDNAG